jgi:hypothetical protein
MAKYEGDRSEPCTLVREHSGESMPGVLQDA